MQRRATTNWQRVCERLHALIALDQCVVLCPPAAALPALDEAAACFAHDFAVWRQLPAERRLPFETAPPAADNRVPVLFQPRSHERLDWWLHIMAISRPDTDMLLVGAHQTGGRQAGERIKRVLGVSARRLDSLGRASIWRFTLPPCPPPPPVSRLLRHGSLILQVWPGVFGYNGVDTGSALLLQELADQPWRGRMLDFGCGCGMLGASLLARHPALELILADSDALALASARATLEANRLTATVIAADGWHGVDGRFDAIVSNPPFHVDGIPDLEVARALIREAPARLNPGGVLILVANRHLPLEAEVTQAFGQVETRAETRHFKVLAAAAAH